MSNLFRRLFSAFVFSYFLGQRFRWYRRWFGGRWERHYIDICRSHIWLTMHPDRKWPEWRQPCSFGTPTIEDYPHQASHERPAMSRSRIAAPLREAAQSALATMTPFKIPEMTSSLVNEACWKVVTALPQCPAIVFNHLKPAFYEGLKFVLESLQKEHETALSQAGQGGQGEVVRETDIYDFAGWLTTRPGVLSVGSSLEAGPMAEAVGEYIKTFPKRFAAQPAPVPAPVASGRNMPALPEARKPDENGAGWFTAGQMLDYAQEALAQRPAPAVPADFDALVKKHARAQYSSSQRDWDVAEFTPEGLRMLVDALSAAPKPETAPTIWSLWEILPSHLIARYEGQVLTEELLQQAASELFAAQVFKPIVVTEAARDVLAERQRQISAEGWTPEHDDHHRDESLAMAAACYSLSRAPLITHRDGKVASMWPWDSKWWKPKDRRHDLIKAGALILAEIERLDRAAATKPAGKEGAAP